MKIVRPAALAGLVLVAGALPVTAFALSSDGHTTPPAAQHATTGTDSPESGTPGTESPETESPETESPETESPDTEAPDTGDHADETATEPAEPEASGQPNPASAAGRAHAAAMQAWAHCVGEAASGPKTPGQQRPPKLACGDKPLAPGQVKHQPSAAPGTSSAPQVSPRSHGRASGKAHAHPHGKRR
jgi:hypothetical protein